MTDLFGINNIYNKEEKNHQQWMRLHWICKSDPLDGTTQNSYGRSYVGMYVYQHEPRFIVSCMDSDSICFFAFLFYIDVLNRIRPVLDDLADPTTNDCPLPRYQMVIDPKQFCRTRTNGTNVWIPCEFDVYRRSPSTPRSNNGHISCTSTLVGEDRAHWMNTNTIDSIATPVLDAT